MRLLFDSKLQEESFTLNCINNLKTMCHVHVYSIYSGYYDVYIHKVSPNTCKFLYVTLISKVNGKTTLITNLMYCNAS